MGRGNGADAGEVDSAIFRGRSLAFLQADQPAGKITVTADAGVLGKVTVELQAVPVKKSETRN